MVLAHCELVMNRLGGLQADGLVYRAVGPGGAQGEGAGAQQLLAAVLHEQLAEDGVHVASVTVVGVIAPGTVLDPDRLADAYWELHAQPRGEWTVDTVVDGR